jgi:hypothetical protein
LAKKVITTLVVVFLLFIFLRGCKKDDLVVSKTTTDTVFVEKIKIIPKIEQVIQYRDPKPLYINVVGKDTIKNYKKVYTDSTNVAEVTIEDSINGTLLNQRVKINVKEREVKYKETVITNNTVTKLKPFMVLSAGLTAQSGLNPTLGAEVGLKNKNGYNVELGYNLRKEFTVGIKKDILTIYNKNK